MKTRILALLLLTATSGWAQFKVVGYLPTYRFGVCNSIDFTKTTHVCLAFGNPNASGDLEISASITTVVNKVHGDGGKAMISIGGGGLSPTTLGYYQTLLQPVNRSAFVSKIKSFLVTNNLDGIDVDLEGSAIDANYGGFVEELADSVQPAGFEVSAALASWNGSSIPNQALDKFDFINLMAYDATGPWSPGNPGQHSAYSFAQGDINYWNTTRGVNKERIVLGVPFYGYEFVDASTVNAHTYGSIVAANAGAEYLDVIGGNLWYNGIPTIKAKTALAYQSASGIMIWELGQDDFGSKSLLCAIRDTLNVLTSIQSPDENHVNIYPNPVVNELNISVPGNMPVSIQIVDVLGMEQVTSSSATGHFDIGNLASGTYVLNVIVKDKMVSKSKFFKL